MVKAILVQIQPPNNFHGIKKNTSTKKKVEVDE